MIPIAIFTILVILALLCTAGLLFIYDRQNYIDVISGVAAVIFWWTSGLCALNGIASDNIEFSASWLMWIHVAVGVVVALITYTRIIDVLDNKNHVSMSFDHRI